MTECTPRVHNPLFRRLPYALAAAGLGALAGCSAAGETASTSSDQKTAETCVAFSYGTLRQDTRQTAPRTADAAKKVAAIAWQFRYGSELPDDFIAGLHSVDLISGKSVSLSEFGAQIDNVFSKQHPALGNGGPVPDDRIGLRFDLKKKTVSVSSYISPFRGASDYNRPSIIPTEINCYSPALP